VSIDCARASLAWRSGGALTRSLLEHAKDRGYLEAGKGLEAQVCVRCTWLDVGEYQHLRDEWHFDNAEKGWLYVDGVAPTQVIFQAFGNKVVTVPLATLFPYHGLEHRSPRAEEAGWRYFFRILHAKRGGFRNRVEPR
jgi:hypothetical protein